MPRQPVTTATATRDDVSPELLDEAIDWMMRLRAAPGSLQVQTRLAQWQAADPRHAQAWDRVATRVGQPLSLLRAAQAEYPGQHALMERALINLPKTDVARRRWMRLGSLGLLLGAAAAAGLAHRQVPLHHLRRDLRTATAERRHYALDDGSVVILNARSAADVVFSPEARQLHLIEGELMVTVAADPTRPFSVLTPQADVTALGTRFMVRRADVATFVWVDRNAVAVTSAGQRTELSAGQANWFTERGVAGPTLQLPDAGSWEHGTRSFRDAPLAEIVDALRPYHTGWIRLDPSLAGMRVFGTLPLDQPVRALQSLAEVFPLRVDTRYGGWLVEIRSNSV